jgi:hypothetical protein
MNTLGSLDENFGGKGAAISDFSRGIDFPYGLVLLESEKSLLED